MYFIDKEHENFYHTKLGQTRFQDVYQKSLLYLLSSNKETRKHFEEIYCIDENEIILESLKAPWQTGTSINTCRLAFNLYGDIVSDEPETGVSYLYTTCEMVKNLEINCCVEALKIRFARENAEIC